MASTTTAPWADTPFELIRVPGNGTDIEKGPEAIYIAAEMASAHNGMLRGLNSIYQQCIHVMLPADVADLLKYTEFWCGWLEEHHAAEETFFFPAVEKAAGVKGLMEGNVEQHHTFLPGLERLERYAKETTVEDYEGKEMRGIIDGFGAAMTTHLREEIETLLGLEKFDGVVMKKLWLEFDAKLREGDKAVLYPLVFGTSDDAYEHGPYWPIVPGFVVYLVHYWFERKHRGVWRFSPSTTWGKKQPLAFTAATK